MEWIKQRPDFACVFLTRHEYNKRSEYKLWRFEWTPGEPPDNKQDDENTIYFYLGWFDNDGDEWDDIKECDFDEYLVIEILPELNKEKKMEQLKLTTKQLLKIGFVKKTYPKDEFNERKIIYKIPCLSGYFYYNENELIYRWYQKIIVGKNANHINLNIESLPELFMVLSCFRVKYNLVV